MTATLPWVGMGIYLAGCAPAFIFYFVGRAPSLIEGNTHWPVIFLWPLLPLWLLRRMVRRLPVVRHRRQKLVFDHQPAAAAR